MKKYRASVLMLLLFEGVAVTLWLTKSNLFYLFNFSYIGSCLSVGLALSPRENAMRGSLCSSQSVFTCSCTWG